MAVAPQALLTSSRSATPELDYSFIIISEVIVTLLAAFNMVHDRGFL